MRFLVISSFLSLCLALVLSARAGNDSSASAGPHRGVPPRAMSGTAMLQCKMMMTSVIRPTDPAAILALKDELRLTPDQVQKLKAIVERSREEAKGVLDEQQNKTLAAMPATPDTSMAMHQHMMDMMHSMHDAHGGQTDHGPMEMSKMNCPMMNMMAAGHATTQPSAGGPAGTDHVDHHH